jgi:hypothetical protein
MSKQVNKTVSNITKSELKNALKTAPNDVYVDHIRATSYHAPPEIGETAVVLVVPASGFPEQFTIHRPIGVTTLKPADWVMTRTSDVSGLLARMKNPNAPLIAQQQARNRTQYLLAKNILQQVGEGIFYPFDGVKTRNDYLSEADEALKKAKKAGTAPDKATRDGYLHEQALRIETQIRNVFQTPEGIEARDRGIDLTFRTRGGILENEEQTAIPGAAGKSLRELHPHLCRMIYKVVGKGEGITVNQMVNGNPEDSPFGRKDPTEEEEEEPMHNTVKQANLEKQVERAATTALDLGSTLANIRELSQGLDKGSKDTDFKLQKQKLTELVAKCSDLCQALYNATKSPGTPFGAAE